jgi:hypothetical protein
MDRDAWARARSIAEGQDWLVTSDQLRRLNLSPSEVGSWLRRGEGCALLRGVYLCDPQMYDEVPEQVWWRAALLRHGPRAMLVGRTGARALGIQGLPPSDPKLEVAVVDCPPRARSTSRPPGDDGPGQVVVVRQLPVTEEQVSVVGGLRVRDPEHTVVDAALQLDRVHALCLLDSALFLELVDRRQMEAAVCGAEHRRGCRELRAMASLADGRSQSPLETRVRLACIDGDLAPDDLQYEVTVPPGIVVAIGDLAWFRKRKRSLLAEADGESVHALPAAVFRDRRRGNTLVTRACDTVRFTWTDAVRPAYVQYVVRSALAAA